MKKRENLIYTEIARTHKNLFDAARSIINPPFVDPGDVIKVYVIRNGDKGESEMTQPDLMRQIADAMERNPDGWWREFEVSTKYNPSWAEAQSPRVVMQAVILNKARPKPRTYTLHIEDMPEPMREEPEIGSIFWRINLDGPDVLQFRWNGTKAQKQWLDAGLCYQFLSNSKQAMDKLKAAMGGE